MLEILRAEYEYARRISKGKGTLRLDDVKLKNKRCTWLFQVKEVLWRNFNKVLLFFLNMYYADDDELEELERHVGANTQANEIMKLNIDFKETLDISNTSLTADKDDPRLVDLNQYWNDKQTHEDRAKILSETKDKSSVNYWMAQLQ